VPTVNSVDSETEERKRRIRRNTLLLSLVAIGIYVAFILMSVLK